MEQDPPQIPEVSVSAASPPVAGSDATPYRLRRVDTTGNDALTHLGRHGADSFGYTAVLTVEPRLAQLLRLRVAQINHCAYCLELHHAAARAAGIADSIIDTLSAWWEPDFHDFATRAALAYAAALTLLADPPVSRTFEERHRDLAAHFDEQAILEIVGVVVNMNVMDPPQARRKALPPASSNERSNPAQALPAAPGLRLDWWRSPAPVRAGAVTVVERTDRQQGACCV